MTKTAPFVSFGLYAQTIKQDSTFAFDEDLQPFSKILDLKTGNVTNKPFATYEQNYWLLDGNYKFKPTTDTTIHIGLMGLDMSDSSGTFDVPPTLTITFASVHSMDAMTLRGSQVSDDYASSIHIAYYDAANALIEEADYSPTSWEFSTDEEVADFKKIELTFNSTNKPYRYLRLTEINFGRLIYFTGADIKSCSVVEEFNPLSIELPVDTCELRLFSNNAAFSIISPTGDYSELKNKQPLDIYETVGNENFYIGQFFLDTWENVSENEILFKAIDMIGVLETVPYLGGLWVTGDEMPAGELLEIIMGAIDTPYDLDPDLYDVLITGWMPVTNYREALQQITFAIGAFITCARSGALQINKIVLAKDLVSYDYTILKSDKGAEQSLKLKTLVTGTEVTAHNYVTNTTITQLYKGTLAIGVHTIIFNAPAWDLTISGGAITARDANYAIITVSVAGTVTLSGKGYDDTTQIFGVYNTTLDPNVKKNVISIKDATLVSPSNVAEIAQRVYDYYQQRYMQKVKLYAPVSATSNSVLVSTLYNKQIGGMVEKMTLNLSGGFTAQAEITGVVVD
jgi:hypothetical protein